MSDDMEFLFAQEDSDAELPVKEDKFYRVLIVDDEPGIHEVTKIALRNYALDGYRLQLNSVYSAQEAKEWLSSNEDIAVILLDVVMETATAGLDVASWIRNELNDQQVRIVLRTGQPGEAPEDQIMLRYDINDYKEKTELTRSKLTTLMHSCIRSYRDIYTIERTRSKLEWIIRCSGRLFAPQSLEAFSEQVISMIEELVQHGGHSQSLAVLNTVTALEYKVVHGTGKFSQNLGASLKEICDIEPYQQLINRGETGSVFSQGNLYSLVRSSKYSFLLFVEGFNMLDDIDLTVLELFMNHVAVGYANTLGLDQ